MQRTKVCVNKECWERLRNWGSESTPQTQLNFQPTATNKMRIKILAASLVLFAATAYSSDAFKSMRLDSSETLMQKNKANPDRCSHIDSKKNMREKIKCLDQQVAVLSKRLEHKSALRGKRVGILTSSIKEPVLVKYLHEWNEKTQLAGNLQYPIETRQNEMRGYAIMSAKINADGSLVGAKVLRSTGYPVLDKAALAAIKNAAPFAAFPEEMRKLYDMVEIIESFNFGNNNLKNNE